MENDRLYLSLRNKLCEMIYEGLYKEDENIPPERALAEELRVSRVTVRKSLHLLEKDGIVERVQGSGTQIRLRKTSYRGTMDLIALVAPAQKPFFAAFIDQFQKKSSQNDSLVLFMQNPKEEKIEDSLFKLFQKNIRNVVVWLEDLELDSEKLRRLRGLGMNIVFFDIGASSPYADCVSLDNKDAVQTLYRFLDEKGMQIITYIGWDNFNLSSIREREACFKDLSSEDDKIFHVSWKDKKQLYQQLQAYMTALKKERELPEAIVCGDGELGIALKRVCLDHAIDAVTIVSIDDFEEAEQLALSVYRQSFEELADKVYSCLLKQNNENNRWQAAVYLVKGKLIKRGN